MTAKNSTDQRQTSTKACQTIIVRRVFKQQGDFHCGICRSSYGVAKSANSCLTHCWENLRNTTTFVPVRKMGRMQFACIYCMRSYSTTSAAHSCAVECMRSMSIFGYDGTKLAKVKRKKLTLSIASAFDSLQPQKEGLSEIEKPISIATASTAPSTTPVVQAQSINTSQKPEERVEEITDASSSAAKAAKEPRDRTKKFERHGAKYVCLVCNAKYFTKEEVEKCFDGHD